MFRTGITLIELLVALVVVAVLVGMLLPPTIEGKKPPFTVRCMNNQRQAVFAAIMYSADSGNRFPWSPFDPDRGADFSGTSADVFTQLRPYLGGHTEVFVCPTDSQRFPTTNSLRLTNLSYFLNLSARLYSTNQVLLGDRHLVVNGSAVGPGETVVAKGSALGWTAELHPLKSVGGCGVVSFVDGHAEALRGAQITTEVFARSAYASQTLLFP